MSPPAAAAFLQGGDASLPAPKKHRFKVDNDSSDDILIYLRTSSTPSASIKHLPPAGLDKKSEATAGLSRIHFGISPHNAAHATFLTNTTVKIKSDTGTLAKWHVLCTLCFIFHFSLMLDKFFDLNLRREFDNRLVHAAVNTVAVTITLILWLLNFRLFN